LQDEGGVVLLADRRFCDLFIASFVALFFELLLVRWLPTEIYLLGYFKNCILIATFVGFGVGCATRYDCTRLIPIFALSIAVTAIAVQLVEQHVALITWKTGEFLWPGTPERAAVRLPLLGLLGGAFIVAAALTMPLGRLVGRHLGAYPPVVAYSINLIASLLGLGTFLALGFLELGPVIWFAIGLLPLTYFVRGSYVSLAAHLFGMVMLLAILRAGMGPSEYWSPYSKVTVTEPSPVFHTRLLSTNNSGHQVLYDLSRSLLANRIDPTHPGWRYIDHHVSEYESAYAVVRPKSVLIIGGGTGNEAAAALRYGVERVHVIEIDPVIISLGRRYHPELPYDDPRVTVINDDARHYMATTAERYDLLIFGFLDSKSQLSSMANIRLDNYVYTIESFRRARDLLAPNGVLQVTYYALSDFVRLRIYRMLESVFGRPPLLYGLADGAYPDFIYFEGPGLRQGNYDLPGLRRWMYRSAPESEVLFATDDWPYLNLETRSVGRDYLTGLLVMMLIAIVFVYIFVWRTGRRERSFGPTSALLFLQGAGFMILETNTIMRMTLVLGSTWVVTSISVALVLAGALAGNGIVARWGSLRVEACLAFLCAALLLNYFVDVHRYLGLQGPIGILGAGVQVYLPIFGSSLLFARIFAGSKESPFDFGMNILGGVCGGVLEYSSLALGVRTVYLVALVLFLALALVHLRAEGMRWPLRKPTAALTCLD
jgi:Spermine/spermidine synthase domain